MSFPASARVALGDAQLRRNLGRATSLIREKRSRAVGELADWEALRDAGEAIKASAMARLPELLERLEASVTRAGGVVHWARDGAEANAIVASIARAQGTDEVIKVKSLATDEIGLNEALEREGMRAIETDLAELIVQLAGDKQSHILVPAIHKNRAEIRALFERTIARGESLGDEASAIAEAARRHLRAKFLSVPMAVSGANFGIAETGTVGGRRVRGQRAHVRDAAARAGDRHGDREGAARVARPRGVPAAAAALLDGRADEPVHVAVDRRDARATGRRSSTSCCSTTAARACWPTRSAGRRCTASAARRA